MTKFKVSNYRSLRDVEIEIPGFTILTGKNNSGKSSILYALLTLKEILTNPNRKLEQLLVINETLNLGRFEDIVFENDESLETSLCLESTQGNKLYFETKFSNKGASSKIVIEDDFNLNIDTNFAFPYSAASVKSFNLDTQNEESLQIDWSGLWGVVKDESYAISHSSQQKNILLSFHTIFFRSLLFVPASRLFTNPDYSTVSIQNDNHNQNTLATLIAQDSFLLKNLNKYLSDITGKTIIPKFIIASASFSLSITDKNTSFMNNIVNEGTGVNQLVTILATIFISKADTILIDEPEVHLHPSAIKKLVSALVDINEKYGKKFIISTHSEHFVSKLLDEIGEQKFSNQKVAMYLAEKDGIETKLEKQEINEVGQIAGGLKNFYEEELTNFADIFSM